MLRIYLDDCSMIRALAEALRREGFEVVTPLEAGTHGAAEGCGERDCEAVEECCTGSHQ
ncbi:hypothetical protein [Fervidibacter sp.]|nr:hypothetical protein [Armatimonadota bacterium]